MYLTVEQEARCMLKARKAGVRTPCLYQLDSANTKITMEKVDGVTAKTFLLDCLKSKSGSRARTRPKEQQDRYEYFMHDVACASTNTTNILS